MQEILSVAYPWIKSLHILAVISWMAGLFYLPRLFVHHSERVNPGSDTHDLFLMMEGKLFRLIMTPAMIVTWVCGVLLLVTDGVIDWAAVWPWTKLVSVVAMTGFHGWLSKQRKIFMSGKDILSGKTYRIMNEVPTILLIIIVVSVVVRPV